MSNQSSIIDIPTRTQFSISYAPKDDDLNSAISLLCDNQKVSVEDLHKSVSEHFVDCDTYEKELRYKTEMLHTYLTKFAIKPIYVWSEDEADDRLGYPHIHVGSLCFCEKEEYVSAHFCCVSTKLPGLQKYTTYDINELLEENPLKWVSEKNPYSPNKRWTVPYVTLPDESFVLPMFSTGARPRRKEGLEMYPSWKECIEVC
jgi:hypothetical protein